jgi:hypothetical protein
MSNDDREPCRNACGRNAALRNGEPAYKGFCSRCYKEDVESRRAGRDGAQAGGVRSDGQVDGGGEGLGHGRDAGPAARDGAAADDGEDTLVRPPRQRGRKPPGGGTVPRPVGGPGAGEVLVGRVRFGWCLTGHHEGDEPAPLAPSDPDLIDHWKGTFPTVCPGVVWLSTQGQWSGCGCGCHDHGALAAPEPAPEPAPA